MCAWCSIVFQKHLNLLNNLYVMMAYGHTMYAFRLFAVATLAVLALVLGG
jgi:hypothetical protein